MTRSHPAIPRRLRLRRVTRKQIRGWAISVAVKLDELAALIRGA